MIHAHMPWDDPDVQPTRDNKQVPHGEDKERSPFYTERNLCPACGKWIRNESFACQKHRVTNFIPNKMQNAILRRAHARRLVRRGIPFYIALALVKRGLYDKHPIDLHDGDLSGQPVRSRCDGDGR